MKIINSIKKSVVLASLGIASLVGMTGCMENCGCDTDAAKKSYAKEYGYTDTYDQLPTFKESDSINNVLPDTIMALEGRIAKVQSSIVSYALSDRSYTSGLEYVFVNDTAGNAHLFIYPYSKGIAEGQAKINYRPLRDGKISSKLFINTFLDKDSHRYSTFPIEAEGIIIGEITKTIKASDTMPSRYTDKDSTITKKGITYIKNNNSIFK